MVFRIWKLSSFRLTHDVSKDGAADVIRTLEVLFVHFCLLFAFLLAMQLIHNRWITFLEIVSLIRFFEKGHMPVQQKLRALWT